MSLAVITGVGLATPLGDSLDILSRRLLAGESAVAPLRHFEASTFRCRVGAQVELSPAEVARASSETGIEEAALWLDRKLLLGRRAARAALADAFPGAPPAGPGLSLGLGLEVLFLPDVVALYDRAARDLGAARVPQLGRRFPVRLPLGEIARQLAAVSGARRVESFVSACAAGAQCVGEAARRVAQGEEVVLAGACDSMLNPMGLGCFQRLGALSEREGADACRPFHAERTGTVIGEGAAFFVLESAARARSRGARVYAEILGYAASLDAHSVTAPHPEGAGAQRALRAAWERAGRPRVGYVSAHGTGTPANDPVEVRAILHVLGDVPIASAKGALGHAMAAAGALELAAALTCFTLGQCPPTAHLDHLDPACAADHVTRARAFHGDAVAKNSFGFGGQNAVLLLGAPR